MRNLVASRVNRDVDDVEGHTLERRQGKQQER